HVALAVSHPMMLPSVNSTTSAPGNLSFGSSCFPDAILWHIEANVDPAVRRNIHRSPFCFNNFAFFAKHVFPLKKGFVE
ncbi:hypothetical protein V5053_25745, partial [Enterobacter hormaechei]|uniref:hypothetical protein n=1 Tax=Enterobacter hormaechei TaxID=158836 RepID=UPI0030767A7B